MTTRDAEGDHPGIKAPKGVTFTITNAKLYVPAKLQNYMLLYQLKMIVNCYSN